MKVLFLEDALPTARAGDIRDVKTGFARNYLIPQGIAVIATTHELRRAEKLRAAAEERRLRELEEWRDLASELERNPVELQVRSGPTGRLYGSVTNAMVAARLSELTERTIERKRVRISEPIRITGDYRVPIRFIEDVNATITLRVISDDQTETESDEDASGEVSYAITDAILESGEIDMHAWEEPQAVAAISDIIGKITTRNITQFRVIHGKGEGILRQAVRDRLDQLRNDGVILTWGPGRNVSDTDADSLEAVCWFTVS